MADSGAPNSAPLAPSGEGAWLADSERGAWDELAVGDSWWPTLCCACSFPWWVLARAAGRTRYLSADTAMTIGLMVFLVLAVGGSVVEATSPNLVALGVVMQLLYVAAIFGATLQLRRHIRATHAIAGDAASDVITSIYPCSAMTLTKLEYQLRVTSPTEPAPSTGAWATTLFSCWPEGAEVFHCAAGYPCFIQSRLNVRMGTQSARHIAMVLAALWLLEVIFFLVADTSTSSGTQGALSFFTFVCAAVSMFVTFSLRQRVRERYGIAGSRCDDGTMAVFCGPCALAQMERQTQDAVARSGGQSAQPQEQQWGGGGGEGLEAQQQQQQQQHQGGGGGYSYVAAAAPQHMGSAPVPASGGGFQATADAAPPSAPSSPGQQQHGHHGQGHHHHAAASSYAPTAVVVDGASSYQTSYQPAGGDTAGVETVKFIA